jgi:hypothetical protein
VLQVTEDLLDHYRIFNTGNHLHGAAADTAGLDVDFEYTFEALCPSHGLVALFRCFVTGVRRLMPTCPFAPPSRKRTELPVSDLS